MEYVLSVMTFPSMEIIPVPMSPTLCPNKPSASLINFAVLLFPFVPVMPIKIHDERSTPSNL